MDTASSTLYSHSFINTISSGTSADSYTQNTNPLISMFNEESMTSYSLPYGYNTLCVKATLGMGKTNALYNFINKKINKKYNSCIIISFRKSLCKKYIHDLHSFKLYENIYDDEIDSSKYPYVVCQIDSIKRIRGHYDLVIFDEVTYTLNHLISSVKSKKRCFDVFKSIMYDENDIVFMDALLNEDYVDYIKFFDRKIYYIINEYSIHKNKSIFNYGTNITSFINEIKFSIEKNENIVIATNNKNMLNFIDNILVNNYKNIAKLMIKKESKSMYDLDNWKNIQVLGYTPSIVAGISYVEKHFNKVFGLFCNSSATADMALQQLFRVRDISTGEFHICCEITGKKDYPEDIYKIKDLIIKEDKCLIDGLENITIDYIKKDIIEDEYFKLFNIYQKNKFKSCNDYIKELINLLKLQGINNITNIKNYDINDKKTLLKNKKEFNKTIKEQEAIRTENAPDYNEQEIEDLQRNPLRSNDDNYAIKKYKLKKILKIKDITKDIILRYDKKGKILWNLAYIFGYDNYRYQLIKRINHDEKRIDMEDNTYRLNRDRKYEKMVLCDHMLRYIGFDGVFDSKYIDINKNKFKEYIIKYHDIIESYFKCNKINLDIFNKDNWYIIAKIYINSKIKTVYGVSIVDDRKNKKHFIKGLEIWNDIVNYKNQDIINEIIENENKLYEDIENNKITNDIVNDILNLSLDEFNEKYDNFNRNVGYEPIVESETVKYYDKTFTNSYLFFKNGSTFPN